MIIKIIKNLFTQGWYKDEKENVFNNINSYGFIFNWM